MSTDATALTVLNNEPSAIQPGGLGIDFSSKLFSLKPATISIVQPSSQVADAIKGNLRIIETGDQFTEMFVTLLVMPTEQRQYYIGSAGEMNRTLENLMCFSRDLIVPDAKAKVPQAVHCANCPRQDWTAWREYKDAHNGQTNKSLIPQCESSYYAVLLDTVYRLPLRMFIRSDAKAPFEAGMQNLARTLAMRNAQGQNSNIFDIRFKLSTKLVQKGKYAYYIPTFSDFKGVTDDERQAFGEIYLQFIASKTRTAPAMIESAPPVNTVNATPVDAVYEKELEEDIPF